ncbi:hypothetical protein [Pseudoalteromonas luteoviolacea]|uniref:hypothetical protein n=1 Tax=Pseudoalteromonas luteoviolacea TaxID=43657 RepID=UPI0011542804|nr:hypothetical protein [Pseudoalteromonas luteoviolacea]TQF67629.1 hypothetical protein FLM44_20825 [Pseudoalteromonas luteoviolacea]
MDYLQYHYGELLKLLVILSSDYDTQLTAYTEEELAIDFENELLPNVESFIEEGYFSQEVISLLLDVDHFFEVRSGRDCNGFWTNLESHPDWVTLRLMAKNILAKLGLEKLKVHIDVKNEYDNNKVIAIKTLVELDKSDL